MVRPRVWLALAMFVLPICTLAQSAPPAPVERFVAASIKPAAERLNQGRAGPDHFYRVTTLASLVGSAFNLPSFLMFGLPDWAFDERWEVSAKAEGPRSSEEMRTLLRALLEERFALRVHYEIRELPVYELIPARADRQLGPWLRPATGECDPFTHGKRPFNESPVDRSGLSRCLGGVLSMAGRVAVQLYNYRMEQFANALRPTVRRSVVDKTGFSGLFDIVFDFRDGPDSLDSGDIPGLETALRESLGLKLQSARAMVDVLVIDSVERPTSN